jgi:hypothetical protein
MFYSSQLGITAGEVRLSIKLTVKSCTEWNIDKTIPKVDQSNAKRCLKPVSFKRKYW